MVLRTSQRHCHPYLAACVRVVVWVVAATGALVAPAQAARYEKLSELEKATADEAMAELGLQPVLHPEGRVVGQLYIATGEVFGPADGFLQVFNILHTTTRDVAIESERILAPGAPFDWARLADMERNLRDPTYRTLINVLPVEHTLAPAPGVVDLLVVSRDVWSLRANTDFRLANATLTFLSVELAENNVAGYNKRAAATALYQLDTIALGVRYVDPRLGWTRHNLLVEHAFLLNHATGAYEGVHGQVAVAFPLYSALRTWGSSFGVAYNSEIYRSFSGAAVRTWDDPSTAIAEAHPIMYDWLSVAGHATATRSFGVNVKHDITFGYRFSYSDAETRDFQGTSAQRQAFERTVLPRSELASGPVFGYSFYLWKYSQLYDFNTFSLLEEFRTGPWLQASVRWASRAFGTPNPFAAYGLTVGFAATPGNDAYIGFDVGTSGRLQGSLVDEQLSAGVRLASPRLWRAGRFHLAARLIWQFDNASNDYYTLGGDTGFRGIAPGVLFGENILRTNLEFRSASFALWIIRIGGVIFYDGGDAFEGTELSWRHSVGLGARILILPVNRNVIRVDYGVPLDGVRAGFAGGTLTAGFEQAF